MVTWVATFLGLFTALSISWLHPRLRTTALIIVPAGLLGGWLGSMLLVPFWQPLLNDLHSAAQVAGGASGGIIAAIIAVVGRVVWTSRTR